jgi:hypothetical protein
MKFALYAIHGIALLGTVAWLVSTPGWEPVLGCLGLIGTLLGVTRMKDDKPAADEANQKAAVEAAKQIGRGRGGSAVTAGKGAIVDVSNVGDGVVRAGKGGTGGHGGNAISVALGVRLTIRNTGVIAGGDAGGAEVDE